MIYSEAKCVNAALGVHIYLIGKKELTLALRPKDFMMVYTVLLFLKNVDIQAFATAINTKFVRNKTNKILHVKQLFIMANELFPNEFKSCVWKICDLFKEKNILINPSRVAKYLFTADLSKIESPKVYIESIKKVTSLVEIVKSYEANMLLQLKEAMNKFDYQSVWTIVRTFEMKQLITEISSSADWYNIIERYVENFGNKLRSERKELKYMNFIRFIMYGDSEIKKINHCLALFESLPVFKEVAINTYNEIIKVSAADQNWDMDDDIWYVYEKNITSHFKRKIDFTGLPDELKKALKIYARELIKDATQNNKQTIVPQKIGPINIVLTYLCSLYPTLNSLSSIAYYHVLHIITHLQTIAIENEKNYSLHTVKRFITEMRLFIDWYYKVNRIDQINPFRKTQFKNVKSYTESIEHIPEEIIEQLQKHLPEAPKWIQNAWTIMMNSGARISDVLGLEENCMDFDKTHQTFILSYVPEKIKRYRALQGVDPYHRIPANDAIVDAIDSQMDLTKDLRFLSGSKNIFLNNNHYSIYVSPAGFIIETINLLIKKYQIIDSEGRLFRYSNHMCRKTVVMDLLEQGASLEDIANFVAHMNIKTTKDYYAELKLNKIAELDSKMFEQLFDSLLIEDVKDSFSLSEKRSLIEEIILGSRETPEGHGHCAKHVSFGPCVKKKCVGCRMLITGPEKLPMWEKLYVEQMKYIEELENQYLQDGIANYNEHRLYQSEVRLLETYQNTISKLIQFAGKRGLEIGQ